MKPKATRLPLPEYEWAFHTVDEDQRDYCWHHEVMRQRGIRPPMRWMERPWLLLREDQRRGLLSLYPAPGSPECSVRLVGEDDSRTGCLADTAARLSSVAERLANDPIRRARAGETLRWPVESVNLRIDWRVSSRQLERDFARLLRRQRNQRGTAAWYYGRAAFKRRGGRRRDVRRRLVDLAIHRAHRAGLRRSQVVELLGPLLEHFGFLNRSRDVKEGILAAKNWATTVKEAAEVVRDWAY